LITDQGDVAVIIEDDPANPGQFVISAYMEFDSTTPSDQDISYSYLSACDFSVTEQNFTASAYISCDSDSYSFRLPPVTSASVTSLVTDTDSLPTGSASHSLHTLLVPVPDLDTRDPEVATFASRKYKPVARKIRPVLADLPDKFRITRNIIGDPLADMPTLSPNPPPFTPTGRYTADNRALIDKVHPGEFLWPQERELMHHFMCIQNQGFAWDDSQRGRFREDFFPPVVMPVVEHKPWVLRNMPIPPGIYEDVCKIIKTKIAAGVYERSNSAYRSRWFTVLKKGGISLRIVHSLEPLNAVTIQHSGVPPHTEQIAEQFAGRACGGILDLYVGYDERALDEVSRDYTTFQTPFGAMRLVTLPMGWTNSVPIFHDDVTYILQAEIPHTTIPYIDDVPIRGPATRYVLPDGSYETHPENSGIRRFIWEYFQGLNRVVQRMKYCHGTFSGYKATLCAEEITVVGHRCTFFGRLPDTSRMAKIVNWGPCQDLSDVRAFLGTVGVTRMFIRNFAHRAHALTILTRKNQPFIFGPEQIAAQEDLKQALLDSPALRPINYASPSPVIFAVDTSHIAIGYHLCQCDADDPKKRYFARFGSITLNDREARFSQPKLELYGLFRALGAMKLYLIGVRNLVIEVDARYIKGMLSKPDLHPGASINRWILAILTFHFTLVHVPGTHHGPDGMSRRRPQPGDEADPPDDIDDWVDELYGFMHIINTDCPRSQPQSRVAIFVSEVADIALPTDEGAIASYSDVPRTIKAQLDDDRVALVRKWLEDLQRPADFSDAEYKSFVRYCMMFFLHAGKLWRKDPQQRHKLVATPASRMSVLRAAHDDVAHKGFYATHSLIALRFWWPHMRADIAWFIRTCRLCQLRQIRNVLIPPTVAIPAPMFAKIYTDTMHLPRSGGFKYIVQGRCSLTHYVEFRALRKESSTALGDWLFEDVLCRWGGLTEIVTDNGPPFVKAVNYLAKKYHIRHIRISGYNSRANGIVERPHFDVRQALFKAVDGDQAKWSRAVYSIFWADRVTIRRRMGCSPYFAVTGSHPILPLDIAEATYLLPPPTSTMTTTDLIAVRAIALQKRHSHLSALHSRVMSARLQAAVRFERDHIATIRDFDFQRGDLVLVRNTAIEKSLNRKMRPRYIGPLVVISRNKGGAYIICELNGSVFDRPIAAFRVIPYFARKSITLPDLDDFLDIPTDRLGDMEASEVTDPDADGSAEGRSIASDSDAESDDATDDMADED
jgi:Integrase zinc binding domain/RNase H-like domain found in reverse transcriptase